MLRLVEENESDQTEPVEVDHAAELVELHRLLLRAEQNPLVPRYARAAMRSYTDLVEGFVKKDAS